MTENMAGQEVFVNKIDESRIETLKNWIGATRAEIGKAIVGQEDLITDVISALLAGGHILLEGVPGIGKTSLIKALGRALDIETGRIQFTPDLMPADILGTRVLVQDKSSGERGAQPRLSFQKGPVFTGLLLADEINRATPRTQSALLEAMQERTVTIGGESMALPRPFMVLATQNPIEMEGTYPLPEAQMDRFFYKLKVPFPSRAEIHEILNRTTSGFQPEIEPVLDAGEISSCQEDVKLIPASDEIKDYAVRLTLATHPSGTKGGPGYMEYIRHGASPRAAQSMVLGAKTYALLDGRLHLTFDDIRRTAKPALRHRLILSFQGEAQGISTDGIVDDLLKSVPERP